MESRISQLTKRSPTLDLLSKMSGFIPFCSSLRAQLRPESPAPRIAILIFDSPFGGFVDGFHTMVRDNSQGL
ncbi:MAG: hypothetical protein ACOCQB_03785 [Halanaerobiaceae bacterium]